jgi:hypothetical protein
MKTFMLLHVILMLYFLMISGCIVCIELLLFIILVLMCEFWLLLFMSEFFLLVVHWKQVLLILLETYCIFSAYRLTTLIIVIMCHCIFQKMNYAICWLWISATDLATHFTVFKEQQKLLVEFQKHKADQRRLLLCLCMTACDLSDQTKDWSVVRETAVSINKNKQMNPWVWY